ncbi:MAG: hypothetical protein R3F20_00885 [Planctomycetota bacterium]
MSHSRFAAIALLVALIASPALADDGNGNGNAVIKHTPVEIGGTLNIQWGSSTAPFGQTLLVISDGIGPTTYPGLGLVCLDLFSPSASIAVDTNLDATGQTSLSIGIPNIPGLTTLAPIYAVALVVDFSQPNPFTISKTVGFYFENPDSYSSANGSLGTPRALHTATALAADSFDNEVEVFVAGGGNGSILAPAADATTELFSPLTRTFRPGPTMAAARALHQAVRLPNGTVLLCGGTDNAGTVTTSCEIFDPVTETLSATGGMTQARAGHVATLLGNGKVLVTGGLPSFVGGTTMLAAILNGALNTGEIYDPATGTWSAVPGTMASKRFGHSQVLLNDGRVMITGGINGGFTLFGQDLPTYTPTCNFYNPVTNAFQSAPSFATARAGHATSVLGNGDVLLTGGIVSGLLSIPTATSSCQRFNGSVWSSAPALPTAVALHSQIAANGNGDAIVMGGVTGTFLALGVSSAAVRHTGTAATPLATVGTNPGDPAEMATARGSHTCTPLYDGTFVVIGGTDGSTAIGGGLVYLEN